MQPKMNFRFLRLAEGEGGDAGGDNGDAGGDNGDAGGEEPKLNEHGYPENTPIKEMTDSQQAAYWKYHSRKNENLLKSSVPKSDYDKVQLELDKINREKLPDSEKAQADAKAAGYEEAFKTFGPRLVRESIRAKVAGRASDETIDEQLEFVDLTKFLTEKGDVDADKVARYASGIAPDKDPGNDGSNGPGPKNKKAWETGSGGGRGGAGSTKHSVRSAQEEHREKLRNK